MRVAIHAYDQTYGGLHGIEDYGVITVDSIEEAEEYGSEMSYDVINSYSDIYEEFEDSAESDGIERDSEEWNDYIDECVQEDIAYNIYLITKETDKSNEELALEFYNDKEEFIKTYCKEAE